MTRKGDEAHCLLGLFIVHRPTLATQAPHAFQVQAPDGRLVLGYELHGLLAASPADFADSSNIEYRPRFIDHADLAAGSRYTPQRIPVVEREGRTFADLLWSMNGDRVLLILTPCPKNVNLIRWGTETWRCIPLVTIPARLDTYPYSGKLAVQTAWKDVYLALQRRSPILYATHPRLPSTSRYLRATAHRMRVTGDSPMEFAFKMSRGTWPITILVRLCKACCTEDDSDERPIYANVTGARGRGQPTPLVPVLEVLAGLDELLGIWLATILHRGLKV
ncbi:hypothetical protein C8Q76DRAFT_791403 [Earliella scabrosa]|nr:hypothetical protein C8Q76DRAFT_791403 [Earliella scabrosa]